VRLVTSAIVLFFLSGCAAKPSGDNTSSARESNDPRAALYKRKCISCHNLVDPTEHQDEEGIQIIDAHTKRINLDEKDKIRLVDYLIENN